MILFYIIQNNIIIIKFMFAVYPISKCFQIEYPLNTDSNVKDTKYKLIN